MSKSKSRWRIVPLSPDWNPQPMDSEAKAYAAVRYCLRNIGSCELYRDGVKLNTYHPGEIAYLGCTERKQHRSWVSA